MKFHIVATNMPALIVAGDSPVNKGWRIHGNATEKEKYGRGE